MSEMRIDVNSKGIADALRAFPKEAKRLIRPKISRGLAEIERDAKLNAPKAETLLTNSIHRGMDPDGLSGYVRVGAAHGVFVEEGTGIYGPEGRPSGVMPPVQSILDWIRVRKITPDDPFMEEEDLAFLIALSIAKRGTPKQPFMQPAMESNREKVFQRIDAAVERLVKAVN